jgi:hypothetical protein
MYKLINESDHHVALGFYNQVKLSSLFYFISFISFTFIFNYLFYHGMLAKCFELKLRLKHLSLILIKYFICWDSPIKIEFKPVKEKC